MLLKSLLCWKLLLSLVTLVETPLVWWTSAHHPLWLTSW